MPAKIPNDAAACSICLAMSGRVFRDVHLALQLASLWRLDPEMCRAARRGLPEDVLERVTPAALHFLVSDVPRGPRARETARRQLMDKTLNILTRGSWLVDCWSKRVASDTKTACSLRIAAARIPFTSRSLVNDYLCCDLVALHNHLC